MVHDRGEARYWDAWCALTCHAVAHGLITYGRYRNGTQRAITHARVSGVWALDRSTVILRATLNDGHFAECILRRGIVRTVPVYNSHTPIMVTNGSVYMGRYNSNARRNEIDVRRLVTVTPKFI